MICKQPSSPISQHLPYVFWFKVDIYMRLAVQKACFQLRKPKDILSTSITENYFLRLMEMAQDLEDPMMLPFHTTGPKYTSSNLTSLILFGN